MRSFGSNFRIVPNAALRVAVAGLVLLLTACAALAPSPCGSLGSAPAANKCASSIQDHAPKVAYSVSGKIAPVVIDARPILKSDKKPPTYIGVAYTVFGTPTDMHVYPWVVVEEEKDSTLAQGLEQRIADALQGIGAGVIRVDAGSHAYAASATRAAQGLGADRIMLITLDEWSVNLNLNWAGTFDFDWGYSVDIFDKAGTPMASFKDSGQDVIKEHASDSPRNMISAAWRARLEKLFERPEVQRSLSPLTEVTRQQ